MRKIRQPKAVRELGQQVRLRREALGLTVEMLADRAGVTADSIDTIEAGTRDLSLSTLLVLAKTLDMAAGELVGGSTSLGPLGLEAAYLFDGCSPELQGAVLRLLGATRRLPRRPR